MKKLLILSLSVQLACLILVTGMNASTPPLAAGGSIEWQNTFGGNNVDYGYSVQQTTDGGYIIAGYTYTDSAAPNDYWRIYLVKTDASGNLIWDKTLGVSDADDFGYSVQQTSDGGYIIAGQTRSSPLQNDNNLLLVKTDAGGNSLWRKTFGGSSNDLGYSVQQTSDGGYIIAGYTTSFGAGSWDVYLVKTDAYGNELWSKTLGGSGAETGESVQQTTDGGYIIAGITDSFGAGSWDVYLVKTDASGNLIWSKTFGGSGDDYGYSVQQTSDGGYIIAGYIFRSPSGPVDVYLLKTDASGNLIWSKTFGNGYGYSVQQTADGGYIVGGGTTGSSDVYLIRTDASGNLLWSKSIGGSGADGGFSVQQTTDGGYIIAGITDSFGAGSYDVYLVKIKGEKIPVLVVPGIMGSFSSCLFDPLCGDYNWDPLGPININLTSAWVLDPIANTYGSLIQTFKDAGYEEGINLFPVPYDWRNRNQDTAAQFLEYKITEAKAASDEHDQVDVVAHSMGGLVTRWYIEAMNKTDIHKFAMLGTPNRGSAKDYYVWEGGNFSVYDYWSRTFFFVPLIETMKAGYGYENRSDREFIQAMVPAARQLLPVYTYLYNLDNQSWINVASMIWRNDLIPFLNYNRLITNLELGNIHIFAGTGQNTLSSIGVRNSAGPDWMDGIPYQIPPTASWQFSNAGDDTVLTASAALGSIAATTTAAGHGDLPNAFRQEAFNFITGQAGQAPQIEQTPLDSGERSLPHLKKFLFIGTRSNVLMGITTKEGYRVGRFPDEKGKIAEIETYYYLGNEQKTPALGLYDPSEGACILAITTKDPEAEYEIYISYSDMETGEKQKVNIKGTVKKDQVKKHMIKIINKKLDAN